MAIGMSEVVHSLAREAKSLRQDSDPKDLVTFGIELTKYQDDPKPMARLFEQLGPEGTAQLLRLTTFAADRSQSYPTEMEHTLTTLKTALANGSSQLRDAEGFADELGRWLLPTELSDEENADLVAHGGLPLSGPAALAQILRGTSFDADFLTGLAGRVEHFERSGDVDPVDYYKLMTPTRFDDYQTRDISGLLFEQLAPTRAGSWTATSEPPDAR
jgi:hypothetical protein